MAKVVLDDEICVHSIELGSRLISPHPNTLQDYPLSLTMYTTNKISLTPTIYLLYVVYWKLLYCIRVNIAQPKYTGQNESESAFSSSRL